MNILDVVQPVIFIVALALLTKPMGRLLVQTLDPHGKTVMDPAIKPLERWFYRILRVQPESEQTWKQYSFSLLMFSLISLLFTYTVLRLQDLLPLNPQQFGAIAPDLAFNTAVSFTTNTNWQSYAGESTMSYFSQMVALSLHNFTSAAVGIAVCAALVRGIARKTSHTIGNFRTDLIRSTLYVLLPISVVLAVLLLSQGIVQNFQHYLSIKTLEESSQTIVQGPMASQVAIKMLGTNGGGFTNANAAHPFENPTPFSNFLQMLAIFLIPAGLTYYLGKEVKHQKHGWAVWSAMLILFLVGLLVSYSSEIQGNPRHLPLGIDTGGGNMEGKETRFGIMGSALFATVTTDASCGAVNCMHDSFMPLGGLIPLLNMQLGEIAFGGVGSGLYGMILFIILAIFVAGLMVGRTPEYLGKKLGASEVKLAAFGILMPIFPILIFTAWGAVSTSGTSSLNNSGPHGFTELLYAFSSGAANNGSAFAGLNANTLWWNSLLAIAMIVGRFGIIIPVLALAGKMAAKKQAVLSDGSFPISGVIFTALLIGTILIVGALTFFPALALGPILEHF